MKMILFLFFTLLTICCMFHDKIMLLGTLAIMLPVTAKIEAEEHSVFFKIEENCFPSDGKTIWHGRLDSLLSCSQMCARRADCKMANFIASQGTCALLRDEQAKQPQKRTGRADHFRLEKINPGLGSRPELAVPSCKSLSSDLNPSGIYWVDVDGGSHANAFKVYCEMDTNGGGWTLVWSYKFTDYENFANKSNAVTPRPDWPAKSDANVSVSTTPPSHEIDFNAVKFSLWKQLGSEFLVKSNINNWVVCLPETGSFVEWQRGNINCEFVKRVTSTCSEAPPPSRFHISYPCGPALRGSQPRGSPRTAYYYFDGCTGRGFPAHDPCGRSKDKGLKNVENPHGNIFVR